MTEPALSPKPPAICLMGPTASGKTDLAVALAERFPLDIVSVDSAMVYRGMDIGTAKPDAVTLVRAPHRLIDLIDPDQSYSAGRFRTDALAAMAAITARGRTPLLAGGSMLYFKALKGGLDQLPPADAVLRAEIEARARRDGWPALHAELQRLDPDTAARLAPNDSQRIERALELCLTTGGPMSALLGKRQQQAMPYRLLEIALLPGDREWLRQRINQRLSLMLEAGLVEELAGLRQRFELRPDLPAMRCVGYRQAWRYLDGETTREDFAAQGAAATRQLAKRQFTWLRGWQDAAYCDPQSPDLFDAVAARVAAFLRDCEAVA